MYFFIFSTSAFCEQVAEVDLEVVFQNLDLKEFEVDLGMRTFGIIKFKITLISKGLYYSFEISQTLIDLIS